VHLDPVGSEPPSTTDSHRLTQTTDSHRHTETADLHRHAQTTDSYRRTQTPGDRTELIGLEDQEDRDDNAPKSPGREGLPKRFRMRHGRHYVDELLGETPLRTVREIPISEIEPPPDEAIDLEVMEESIRQLGVIEPLLIGRRGLQYRVITGMRRLRAARTVGLSTVPCLVQDVDEQKLSDMREAASQRLAVTLPAPPEPAAEVSPVPLADAPEKPLSFSADPASAFDQAPTLLGATTPGVDEGLRQTVLADLSAVEHLRAKIASVAAGSLARPVSIDFERTPVSCNELIDDVLSAVAVEARLRGVGIMKAQGSGLKAQGAQAFGLTAQDSGLEDQDCRISLDVSRCRMALTGLLQCLLTLVPGPGTTLDVRAQMTTLRPALIIDCSLRDFDAYLTDEAVARFFDADWVEHPCGAAGAQVLAALARTAKAHGGRVQAQSSGAVTFVVPRPLSDF
jgi:hypothetical protein